MKRILLFSVITIASLGWTNAQSTSQNDSPQARAKGMVVAINKAVSLHGDQFGEVNKAYIEYFNKLDALDKQKAALNSADYQSQLAALQTNRDTKVKSSLDAGQVKNWQTFKTQNSGK